MSLLSFSHVGGGSRQIAPNSGFHRDACWGFLWWKVGCTFVKKSSATFPLPDWWWLVYRAYIQAHYVYMHFKWNIDLIPFVFIQWFCSDICSDKLGSSKCIESFLTYADLLSQKSAELYIVYILLFGWSSFLHFTK